MTATTTTTSNPVRPLADRITDKVIALIWVAASVIVFHYSHTSSVLFDSDSAAVRPLLQIAAVGFGVNTVLTAYLTLYLPLAKGLNSSDVWPVYCPRVIPTMTVVAICTGIVLMRAVWPVYGFLSPLILAVEALGCLFALQFIPWPC